MARDRKSSVGRRDFLKRAAVAGAGVAAVPTAPAGATQSAAVPAQRGPVQVRGNLDAREETPPVVDGLTQDNCGADFMVDVIKSLGVEYVVGNTSDNVRALQESIVNYGGNEKPEFLTVVHEEMGVGMAHGYAKIEGRPLGVSGKGTVGLMHASMAVYNAYCDRVPALLFFGNEIDASLRLGGWHAAVLDGAGLVRDFVKYDDQPASLQHFADSALHAYRFAMTPPAGPALLMLDMELQERAIANRAALRIPKIAVPTAPVADHNAVNELARLLVAADNPVLVAGRLARTPAGLAAFTELANVLQCAVTPGTDRMNFPSHHPLAVGQRVIGDADVIVGFEVVDLFGLTNSYTERLHPVIAKRPLKAKIVSVGLNDFSVKSNYQNFARYPEADLAIGGDGEATLPFLVEAVKRQMTDDRRRVFEARGAKFGAMSTVAREHAREAMTHAWDASPITTQRLSAEIWNQVRLEDWSLVTNAIGVPTALWKFEKHYQQIGSRGGGGLGYGPPAAVGAALANRKHGRLSVAILGDGDLMYTSSVLWTAAHHRIPMLVVVHNNRGYHQELMHLQKMACRHNRGIDRAHIGCELDNPAIDYAKLAQGLGWQAEGPISNPKDLGPALTRALAVVKRGGQALLDVVSQPR